MQKVTRCTRAVGALVLLIVTLTPFPIGVAVAHAAATQAAAAPAAQPNLQVESWSFKGGTAAADVDLGNQLALVVVNNGTSAAPGGYSIQLYISEDLALSSDDTELAQATLSGPALPPAKTSVVEIPPNARIPAGHAPGVYYLIVSVDHSDAVAESAENDNQSAIAVVVLDPAEPFTWAVTTAQDIVAVGTFRHALTYARSGDTIKFVEPQFITNGQTGLVLLKPLPPLSQGDLRIVSPATGVFLDGLLLPAGAGGLVIASDDNHLTGMSVRNMPGDGVQILGNNNRFDGDLDAGQQVQAAASIAGPSSAPIHVVTNNSGNGILITGHGNSVDGTHVTANGANGILLADGASGNTIGSTLPGRGNLISGNQQTGVRLQGAGVQNNLLHGNFVGTDFAGFNIFPNQNHGVVIAQDASNNQIGGPGNGEGNLVSGNIGMGVMIVESDANQVRGNQIGTRIDGLTHLPNFGGGILMTDAANNQIGGASPTACSDDCNLISGNSGPGLVIQGASSSGNNIHGNSVGLTVDWSGAVSNSGNGMELRNGAANNEIGGASQEEGNSVAGNMGHGLLLSDAGVQNNLVQRNRFGNLFPGGAYGNGGYGIAVQNAGANQIGGTTAQRNLIRYNIMGGVLVENTNLTELRENNIQLNGNDPAASEPGSGVLIASGSANSQVEANNISLNYGRGLSVMQANQNQIRLNTLSFNGLDGVRLLEATATSVLSNVVGNNSDNGIVLEVAANNTVRGNTVSGNGIAPGDPMTGQGIVLHNKSSNNSVVSNTVESNLGDGLRISDLSVDNNVDDNTFKGNKDHGIQIVNANTNTLINNDILQSERNGIYVYEVNTCWLTSNRVEANGHNGIELAETHHCIIDINEIRDNGDDPVNAAAMMEGNNLQNGILIHQTSTHNQVLENTISHNFGSGIRVADSFTEQNTLSLNQIDRHELYGILFILGARDNMADHNEIWLNKADGIGVLGPDTLRNLLTENSIFTNGDLAIDNVSGGNLELTPPLVTAYSEITASVWSITGATCANCVVEVFSDHSTEGRFYEGTTTADGAGNFVATGLSRTGNYFALTTRLPDGNTSELNVINDILIQDVEVTQVVQSVDPLPNFDNTVRLIAGKPTVVRVHLNSTIGVMPNVTALLYGEHDGVNVGALTPNHTQCPLYVEIVPNPDRANLDDGFCFVLPDSWIALGDLDLTAHVNPTAFAPELNYANNTYFLPAPVTFEAPGHSPRLRFYRFAHRQSLVRGLAVQRGLHKRDDIDVGDIDGDGREDIVVASRDSDRIVVYPTVGFSATSGTTITAPLTSVGTTFDNGYAMAVGNVDDDAQVEVVVASDKVGDDPDIRVFQWDGANLVYEAGFDGNFTVLDSLAVGNLVPGDAGRNEIAVAGDATGRVDVFGWNGSTWTLLGDFDSTYDLDNGFAVGDVIDGDGVEEVLIGRNALNDIDVYQWNGSNWSKIDTFDATVKGASGLVAADVDGEPFNGNMIAEIVVGNPKSNCRCLDVYKLGPSGWTLTSRSDGFNFDKALKPFQSGDLLAAGDLDQDGKDDVIVGQIDQSQIKAYTKRTIGPWDVVLTDEIHVRYLRSFLLRAMPITELSVLGLIDGLDLQLANDAGTPDADELNALLRKMQRQAGEHKNDQLAIYYGLVSDADEFMRGRSKGEGKPASGPTGVGHRWDSDGSYGDWYGMHEIGHSLDRPHARFCGAEDEDVNYADYAYEQDADEGVEAFIGGPPGARTRFYGFDVGDASLALTDGSTGLPMRVLPGDEWTDLMSYCDFEWISDYNYNNFYNHLNGLFPAGFQQLRGGEYLALEGALDLSAGAGDVFSVYTVQDPSQAPEQDPNSPLILRLENLNGNTIATHALALEPDSDPEPGGGDLVSFEAVVPLPPEMVTLRLFYTSTEIFSRTVSLNRPTVALRSPNGGERLEGPVVVEWQGKDGDGDALRYTLLYSADGGKTYEPLVANWPEERYELSSSQLRGTQQGRFKVIVEDGVYSSEDTSDADFSVAANPLRAEIIAPIAGSVFVVGQDVLLQGRAAAPNGESLDDVRYAWTSNRSGALGNGQTLLLPDLPVGMHTLTLEVSNEGNPSGTTSIQIQVSNAYDNGSTPVAADDNATTAEETPVVVEALANDGDPNDDPLTIVAVTAAMHGAAEIVQEGKALRYTPDTDYVGTDSFGYTIDDGNGGQASAQITVQVTGVNDGPVALDDSRMTAVSTAVTVPVLLNDTDADGDPLTVVSVEAPAHGAAQVTAAGIRYEPDADFTGADVFGYTIDDGNGGQSEAMVTVEVSGLPLSPPPLTEPPDPEPRSPVSTTYLPLVSGE